MAEDYYDESAENSPAPKRESDKGMADSEGLLPISFFPEPPRPGKRCMIQVERVYDDQVGVSYVEHGSKELPSESPEMPEEEMDERYA